MLRKLLLPLSLLVTVAMLAGCAAQPTAAPAPTAPAAESPTEAAPAAEAPTEAAPAATGNVKELNILWAQWDPADFLQQLVADYETETGIKVNVVQEPWGSFGDRFFAEMAAGGDAWDMVIGDSQWLGQGSTSSYYVDLTDFLAWFTYEP